MILGSIARTIADCLVGESNRTRRRNIQKDHCSRETGLTHNQLSRLPSYRGLDRNPRETAGRLVPAPSLVAAASRIAMSQPVGPASPMSSSMSSAGGSVIDDLQSPTSVLASSLVSSASSSTAAAATSKAVPTTSERVVSEILTTERLYLNSLQTLQQQYLIPLQGFALQSELGVKPPQIAIIFSNLQGICGFHVILEEELRTKLAKVSAADQVTELAQIFVKYGQFEKRVCNGRIDGHWGGLYLHCRIIFSPSACARHRTLAALFR
jgi:hypothetical protein